MAKNTGQLIGGVVGGVAGSAIPGLGTTMGAGIGSSLGQLFDARQSKKDVEAMQPSLEDVEMRRYLNEIDQKRKSLETGSAFATGMREADQALGATQSNIMRSTGGDIGATVAALNKAQRAAGSNINQVLAQGEAQQRYYNSLYGDTLQRMAARRLQLQLAGQTQARAEAAQTQQDAMGNLLGSLAKIAPIGGGGSMKGITPTGATMGGVNIGEVASNIPSMATPPFFGGASPSPSPVEDLQNNFEKSQAEYADQVDQDIASGMFE